MSPNREASQLQSAGASPRPLELMDPEGGQSSEAAGRVLIVDENPFVREVMTELLADLGYAAVCRGEPPDPAVVRDLQPILVVLDLVYRRRPLGLDLLTRMAAADLATIPIIVCTGDRHLAEDADLLGRAVLLKPFDIDEFSALVEQVLLRSTTLARGPTRRAPDCGSATRGTSRATPKN